MPHDSRLTDLLHSPGNPWPLGATWDGAGTQFALYSGVAERVELCLFSADGQQEQARIALACTDGIWHGYLQGCVPGTLYGYRVHGPYLPEAGDRCNADKLLLDPYAKAIQGPLRACPQHLGYDLQNDSADPTDNAAYVPKCVVVDDHFDWGDDRTPAIPPDQTVLYELHVKGFTRQHPDVPEAQRGTYAGLASDAAIAHLQGLGVTSVELLPIHAFLDDQRLRDLGLVNYWGYNTVAYLAPEPRYGQGDPVNEFKAMVRSLHRAGLEVILDVVYNHTGEGSELGPTLNLRGIDNAAYYWLQPEDRSRCLDFTGTGNSLDLRQPAALRLVMDSLRYWVQEMHVDGFRFDLATTLARGSQGYDPQSAFLNAVAQDPVLARVKWIAEPWDVGLGGYQVGAFPRGWHEWNGRYRDAVRDFWRGEPGALPGLAAALCGSAELYAPARRRPSASVNFVTAHDGFTLHDLVSHHDKHNLANGEDNRDGESHNRSWNCGAEGPTDDPAIQALRERQKRNLLATLCLSQGMPMLVAGDEMGRTQQGNNNAYCQDNPLSWLDWSDTRRADPLIAFTRHLLQLRQAHPVLRSEQWRTGLAGDAGRKDITWISVWGLEMTPQEWTQPDVRCFGAWLQDSSGGSLLLLFNASTDTALFTLPAAAAPGWCVLLDTTEPTGQRANPLQPVGGSQLPLYAHSLLVLGASSTHTDPCAP